MYQKDFILRMIDMLAEIVAGIRGLISKGDFQKASQAIDVAYQNLLKQDAVFFDKIPVNQLTDRLIHKYNYTSGHLEILSELIYTQAELSYAQRNYNESLEYYQKSLFLLEFVIKETETFSFEKQLRLSYLENRIAILENERS